MLTVHVISFRRKRNSRPEVGLMINEDMLIIDSKAKIVETVWTFQHMWWRGALAVDTRETPMKGSLDKGDEMAAAIREFHKRKNRRKT